MGTYSICKQFLHGVEQELRRVGLPVPVLFELLSKGASYGYLLSLEETLEE